MFQRRAWEEREKDVLEISSLAIGLQADLLENRTRYNSSSGLKLSIALALAVWAASLSTLDSILLTLASIIDIDLLGRGSVKIGRISVSGMILVLGVFSPHTVALW